MSALVAALGGVPPHGPDTTTATPNTSANAAPNKPASCFIDHSADERALRSDEKSAAGATYATRLFGGHSPVASDAYRAVIQCEATPCLNRNPANPRPGGDTRPGGGLMHYESLGVLAQVGAEPTSTGLPGAQLVEQMINWLDQVAVWGSWASILGGAAI